jgi:hypothetical protein
VLLKRAVVVLLVLLVIGTFCILRVESVSVWLRASNPQTDAGTSSTGGSGAFADDGGGARSQLVEVHSSTPCLPGGRLLRSTYRLATSAS